MYAVQIDTKSNVYPGDIARDYGNFRTTSASVFSTWGRKTSILFIVQATLRFVS